jgi:hypothetical protein
MEILHPTANAIGTHAPPADGLEPISGKSAHDKSIVLEDGVVVPPGKAIGGELKSELFPWTNFQEKINRLLISLKLVPDLIQTAGKNIID